MNWKQLTNKPQSRPPLAAQSLGGETMPKQWKTPGGDALNLYTDILKQPHTLIAGTTGSGKSVVINGIIYTALYKAPPQARFILIDPKMLELWMYKDLPHTLKYCDTTADTLETLEEAAAEMMREYSRIRAAGLKQSDHAHTYIIIDELGDLLTEAPQITHTLARLAKLGRAANIHIIAATQNPNRKTLSAEFSANCPARLGLRCENPIESRQIINNPAAVNLPLHGYAYYKAPQYLTPQLCEIPFYTDSELAARVQWWTDQAK